ncbi:hypothetical protein EXIGLDRAFT_194609 [Exidia glandulosa HHB12029]|uniref:Uncharacterized protein n=1 Tax=Exidia glandulosa HHB12029 TaxID=1314781 RepID=A0A165EVY7_EXIGL|nr:hypothetical protein EXIGLDRAFT_194609 [Exidia glandulosa HHB12029]
MSATDTPAAAVDEHHVAHRDEDSEPVTIPEHDDGSPDFISFSESAPLRPLSFDIRTREERMSQPEEESLSSFLSLTPDPPSTDRVAGDSSFLSFADTPPTSSTPDPLSETLLVVQEEEEEEEEEDIGGEAKEEEEVKEVIVGDRDEEIDLGDAILLESGRDETVVIDEEAGDSQVEGFYYDKELKRWVPAKKA